MPDHPASPPSIPEKPGGSDTQGYQTRRGIGADRSERDGGFGAGAELITSGNDQPAGHGPRFRSEPIEGAEVVIHSADRSASTSPAGAFRLDALSPGRYWVTVR
jgi:hypothetical protein